MILKSEQFGLSLSNLSKRCRWTDSVDSELSDLGLHCFRAQPRGQFRRNFALNWAQGEVGVNLKKNFFFFFFFKNFIKSFHKQAVMAI